MKRFAFLLLVYLSVTSLTAFAQSQLRDVVYLKNGSIIKGVILEQIPNQSVKIQTSDGSIFVYNSSEVEKITREAESGPTPDPKTQTPTPPPPATAKQSRDQHSIMFGLSLPTGDFGSTSSQYAGYAKTGFSLGMEYTHTIGNAFVWPTSVMFSMNPTNEAELYRQLGFPSGLSLTVSPTYTIWPLTGPGFQVSQPGVSFQGAAQLGLLIGRCPQINMRYGDNVSEQPSAGANSLAFSLVSNLQLQEVKLSGRFLTGKPKYHVTATGGGMSTSGTFEQPTSVFLVLVGIRF